MDCTDAYREALIRDLSATGSSAPPPGRAAEAGGEGAAGRPAQPRTDAGQDDRDSHGTVAGAAEAGAGPAITLATDAAGPG